MLSAAGAALLVVLLWGTTASASLVVPNPKACLQNLVVHRATSTTAQLSWEFKCASADLQLYKVHYSHLRYQPNHSFELLTLYDRQELRRSFQESRDNSVERVGR